MTVIALIIAAFVALLDQIIKYSIVNNIKPHGTVSIISGVLNITYVENRGVAFGMFTDMRWIFVALTALMIFAIIFYMFKKRPEGKFFYIVAGLIIGGGLGNLYDRIVNGYVIDYISLSFFPPVCNFADYCITVGVILLIFYVLFKPSRKNKKVKKND